MVNTSGIANQDGDMIYVEDVMAIFEGKASKCVIYAWIREKKLKAFKIGRRYVFSRKTVEAFKAKGLGLTA